MGDRRMLNKKITMDDDFLDMPFSTQCLYFQLNLHADDDGFVNNPKSIMRAVGAKEDDFRILMAKMYVLAFDTGVIVIRHWRMHNYIRSDRYKPTEYQEEFQQLESSEDRAYILKDTNGIPKVSLSKDKLSKDNINIYNNTLVQKNDEFEAAFERFWGAYPKKQDKKTAKARLQKALKETDIETIIAAVEKHKLTAQWQKDKGQFIPLPSTWLHEERWNDEVDTSKPKSNNNFNNFDQHGYDIKDLTRRAKE